MIVRNSCPIGTEDYSFLTSVAYKVGYCYVNKFQKSMLISLSDGMAIIYDNDDKLIEHLNNDVFGYRPMTTEEMNNINNYQGNRFPNE